MREHGFEMFLFDPRNVSPIAGNITHMPVIQIFPWNSYTLGPEPT